MSSRIVVVEDLVLMREMIRSGVEEIATPKYEIISELTTVEEVRQYDWARHKPDFVILDLSLEYKNASFIIPKIEVASPATKIIIHTIHLTANNYQLCLYPNVFGYLSKTDHTLDLALAAAMKNEMYISESIESDVKRVVSRSQKPLLFQLTESEHKVLREIALGRSSKQIAEILHRSISTIESIRSNVLQKSGATNMPALVSLLHQRGEL